MKDFGISDLELKKTIRTSLGLSPKATTPPHASQTLDEAYVAQAKKFNLPTELLSEKSKRAHFEIFEGYVESLNKVSAELDTADRENANTEDSEFRNLKIDEIYNLNASFLHGLFFDNIGDLNSQLTMDSLIFMRLERDFGTFDAWQKDFIACAMSSRNGWAVTVYNTFLQRYINVCVDLNTVNVPFASFPIIVIDCWEHAYYRDYLDDRKTYIFAMMKELNWEVIEERIKKAEKIGKITR